MAKVRPALEKKRFIRFTPAIDILVLREIAASNPYETPTKWTKVLDNSNTAVATIRPDAKAFTERSLKERVATLLAAFIKEDMDSLKRSGTEEEYDEREQLLQEIRELKDESENVKQERKTDKAAKKVKEECQGEEVRRKAMEGMTSKEPTPKKAKFDVGDYLQKKNQTEDRRLEFEERKFNADREERKAFMEMLMQLAKK